MVEAMEIPKGFEKTEVGIIPDDWNSIQLKELVKLKSGFAFSSQFFSNTGPILLTPGNFKLEGGLYFNERNTKRFSGEYNTAMQFEYGDLLLVMTDLTPDCNLLGKPAFININETILHNQRIGKIELLRRDLSKKYLYWMFLSNIYLKRIKETATGSTVRHTSNGSIYGTYIPLPPTKAEQTAIAEALNDADALITELEKLIAKKKAIKQGAMQELLKPKEGWEVKSFGEVFRKINAKVFQLQTKDYKSSGSFPIIDQGQEIIVGFTDNMYKIFKCPKSGIIVFGDHTRILKFVDFYFAVGADGTQLLDVKEKYSPRFMFYYLSLNEVPNTGYNRHFKFLLEMNYHVPSDKSEQTRIAQILSDMDAEIDTLEKKLDKYKMLKQGMMQNLLTGKIRLI